MADAQTLAEQILTVICVPAFGDCPEVEEQPTEGQIILSGYIISGLCFPVMFSSTTYLSKNLRKDIAMMRARPTRNAMLTAIKEENIILKMSS